MGERRDRLVVLKRCIESVVYSSHGISFGGVVHTFLYIQVANAAFRVLYVVVNITKWRVRYYLLCFSFRVMLMLVRLSDLPQILQLLERGSIRHNVGKKQPQRNSRTSKWERCWSVSTGNEC